MSVLSSIKEMVGIPDGLGIAPPTYRAITEGLTVSDTCAQAWFVIPPASSQLHTEYELEDEVVRVINGLGKSLKDRRCQLKILWGALTCGDYVNEVEGNPQWINDRATNINSWGLAERHVLLGVEIEDRTSSLVIRGLKSATEWVNNDEKTIPRNELIALTRMVQKLSGQLIDTPLRARPAPVDVLSWMIRRETYRPNTAAAPRSIISGSGAQRLVTGRMLPYPDHCEFFGVDGRTSAYVTYLGITGFPEEMEVPGNGEWLLTLSSITRPTIEGEAGDTIPVHPEASIYFDLLSSQAATKDFERVRKMAKEQQRSASEGIAGDAGDEVATVLSEAEAWKLELKRAKTAIVRAWPIISVAEDNLAALEASVDAVVQHYANEGIDLEVLTDEQAEAWLQGLPSDRNRITDLDQVLDGRGFFGSWFWGGSVVGEKAGPVIGYTTGATAMPVRVWPSQAPREGDSSTTAIVGRSGRGKTTLMQLIALDEANNGAWVSLFDFKGDLDNKHGGICAAAREYGIRAVSAEVGPEFAGAADLLALSPPDLALSQSHAQLMLLVSKELRPAAEPILRKAIADLLELGGPRSSALLIENLAASKNPVAHRVAENLASLANDRYGASIVAPMPGAPPLDNEPGLHLIRFPGLTPPRSDISPSDWNSAEELQAAVMRGLLAWVTQTAGTDRLRMMRKVTCVPEAHLLTASSDGTAFLSSTARMARALGQGLIVDTQDTASLADDGIMEQIVNVFGFAQQTRTQQDALALLLGLEVNDISRSIIGTISTDPQTGDVWHGHCLVRDRRGRVATVQVTYPNDYVAKLLDTSPSSGKENTDAAA